MLTHVSVEDAVHEEDHEALERGEEAEQPLDDLGEGAVPHHKEPQHPRDAQDGDQHQRGMEQGAACGEGGGGGEYLGGSQQGKVLSKGFFFLLP